MVIVAILAAMVSVSVISVRAGQAAARMKGATRDIMAVVRHARSIALITQQPAIISYSETSTDGEISAHVEITSAKVLDTEAKSEIVHTLQGEIVGGTSDAAEESSVSAESADSSTEPGNTVEGVLFGKISEEVLRGIRIKVTMGDELLEYEESEEKSRPKISVFSTTDYLLSKFGEADKKAQEEKKEETATDPTLASETQEKVSVVWQTNGRTDPHRIWVYPEGARPDSGLSIKIDRFGAAKILASGEDD